jgi:hypothetical protein
VSSFRSGTPVLGALAVLVTTAGWPSSAPHAAAPGDELPDGAGKRVLLRACTTCHELDEVTKFKGYYSRAQWKDIVVTMRDYGATLADGEVDALTDYLAETLGKKE